AGLIRKERGVNAAEYDECATRARKPPDGVAAQRIRRVNADSDHVARRDRGCIERIERLVDDARLAESPGCGGGRHLHPSPGDDGKANRQTAGIDKMYAHRFDTHAGGHTAAVRTDRHHFVMRGMAEGAARAGRLLPGFTRIAGDERSGDRLADALEETGRSDR